MPDYIKIRFKAADDVETRMKQLDPTSLPLPLRFHACIKVENAQQLERLAHDVFSAQRARSNRQLFLMNAPQLST
ncbi:GIY-YIG nuclease family protein [Aquiluna sp. Uisw_065]|uniref:GIY-YIG nuclease family protein n=1 Tax=Aquiluna sp. Uisw_065 TaxID=3230967 RepID=UPI0039EA73C5